MLRPVPPYHVILDDPPCGFDDKLPGKKRGAENNYEVMTVEEIMAYPIPETTRDAWLFLWRVASMVPEAYRVVEAWGFVAKAEIEWEKTTKTGKPWFGMGHYVRNSHETCILAVKGHPKPLSRSVRSRFAAPYTRHSEKPARFYEIVEELAEGPYIELFARQRRLGWDATGRELPAKEKAGADVSRLPFWD